MRALWFLAVVVACNPEPADPPAAPPPPPPITVKLASTRLGASCEPDAPPTSARPGEKQDIPCDQTAVHLSIRSLPAAPRARMKLTKAELLDRDGTWLQTLTAHSPRRWGTDQFVPWDEMIAPNQLLSVGYKLSSPDWSKLPDANKRTFRLRVTVEVDGAPRTFEATAELRIEDNRNVMT